MDEWLSGRHSVSEVLCGRNRSIREVWVESGRRHPDLEKLMAAARRAGVEVRRVTPSALAGLPVGVRQRVAARCGPFRYLAEANLPAVDPAASANLVVVLDRIQDPQNLGAIVRTAEAAGAAALCIPKRHASGITPAVVSASGGATEHLPIHRVGNVAGVLRKLQDLGYWNVGLDSAATTSWDEVDYRGGTALVVGAEGKGLRRLVAERCDFIVTLPMAGRVASLNAGAAFAAVAFEVVRQQRRADPGGSLIRRRKSR